MGRDGRSAGRERDRDRDRDRDGRDGRDARDARDREKRREEEEREKERELLRAKELKHEKEQRAIQNVTSCFQRMKGINLSNFESLKSDFERIMASELPYCGEKESELRAEATGVLSEAEEAIAKAKKAHEEEMKRREEEERIRLEQEAKAKRQQAANMNASGSHFETLHKLLVLCWVIVYFFESFLFRFSRFFELPFFFPVLLVECEFCSD